MEKDFDSWNEKKKATDSSVAPTPYFKEGDIWWVSLGLNIGFEVNGKGLAFARPVIILKKYNAHSFLALPLNTTKKRNKYLISVGIIGDREAAACLSQIRNIDAKRLIRRICFLDQGTFHTLKKNASQVNFG